MFEIKVTVNCPDISAAITALAESLRGAHSAPKSIDSGCETTVFPAPDMAAQTAAPAPTAPAQPMPSVPQFAPGGPVTMDIPVVPFPAAPVTSPETVVAPVPAPQPAPQPAPAPVGAAPTVPVVPTAQAPQITAAQIAAAGANLLAANPKMIDTLNALLQKYAVANAMQLKPEQIGEFAAELRGLGANI